MEESHWSQSELDPELTSQDQFDAPQRTPLPTGDWLPSNAVKAQLVVQSAPQITAERRTEAGTAPTTQEATQHVASLRTNVNREDSSIHTSPKVPTFVSVPPRILHASNQRPQLSPLPAEESEVGQSPEPSDMASVVPDESTTDAQSDTASLPILPNPVRDPQQSTTASDLLLAGEQLQLEADDEDAMMRIPSLEGGEALARPVPVPLRTPSVTLHTTRLLELSQQLVLRSQQSLQRGATHTARKFAIEAMQAVVAMRVAE